MVNPALSLKAFAAKRRARSARSKPPGMAPGSLVFTGRVRGEAPLLHLTRYDALGATEEELTDDFDAGSLRGASGVTWLNVDGVHDTDVVQRLGSALALHPLILEDVVHVSQRPKAESYGDNLFVVLRMLRLDDQDGTVASEQVSLVLGPEFVVSFQEERGDVFEGVRQRIRGEGGRIRTRGPDYLAYALIDSVVDHYFLIIDRLVERADALEMEVFAGSGAALAPEIHRLRQELLAVRRAVWPLRELTNQLVRGEGALLTEETRIYLRDVHDHVVQVIDMAESLRDLINGLMDLHLSSVSQRTNEVMKVLTMIASLFIPLSFLAGLYGMNFDYMPELHERWAYPALLGVMFTAAGGMLWFFRRKGWF